MDILTLVQQADNVYPCSVVYKGKLTEEERNELEKFCSVRTLSVFIDGTVTYCITYLEDYNDEN